MLTLRPRLAVAGVAALAALAVPAAALASGSGSPPAKPFPSAPAAEASKPATGPTGPSGLAPAAAASRKAAARRAQGQGGGPSIAAALGRQLGVSGSVAQHTIAQLEALGRGGVDPTSPAFAAIAHGLGVSPARLASALDAAKQSLAGK